MAKAPRKPTQPADKAEEIPLEKLIASEEALTQAGEDLYEGTVKIHDFDADSGLIRDAAFSDAEMPIPEGFKPVPSLDLTPNPSNPNPGSYTSFVNSGYDRTALAQAKADAGNRAVPAPLALKPDASYVSRIRVMEAWQYMPRELATNAPEWVDRNWLAYEGPDPLRQLPAGPVLKVPTNNDPNTRTVCRPGDVIARQEVMLDNSRSHIEIEVWSLEQFARMFMATDGTDPNPAHAIEIDA